MSLILCIVDPKIITEKIQDVAVASMLRERRYCVNFSLPTSYRNTMWMIAIIYSISLLTSKCIAIIWTSL